MDKGTSCLRGRGGASLQRTSSSRSWGAISWECSRLRFPPRSKKCKLIHRCHTIKFPISLLLSIATTLLTTDRDVHASSAVPRHNNQHSRPKFRAEMEAMSSLWLWLVCGFLFFYLHRFPEQSGHFCGSAISRTYSFQLSVYLVAPSRCSPAAFPPEIPEVLRNHYTNDSGGMIMRVQSTGI